MRTAGDSDSPPRRRERNADASRRRILDAAEREFALKGFDGARLREVAMAAEVHHALLHHYYRDKAGLFGAVLDRALGGVTMKAEATLRAADAIEELFPRYVELVADFFAENRNLVLILHLSTLDDRSPAFTMVQDAVHRLVLPLLEATRARLEAGQREGVVRPDIDVRHLVAAAMGAAAYVFHQDRLFELFFGRDVRGEAARRVHKSTAVRVLMEGLLAEPTPKTAERRGV